MNVTVECVEIVNRKEKEQPTMNKHVEALREALAQQRQYERENWPFVDEDNKPTGTGESITHLLASLYCWSPEYVLTLPAEQRDERLREIWRSFSIAGDIIHRYELAAMALLESASFTDDASSYQAMEAALQLLTANILNLRTEMLAIKAAVVKDDQEAKAEQEYQDTQNYMEHHYLGGE